MYVGFAAAGSVVALAGLFAAYGLYIAATEGTSKALIGRAIPRQRASALGLYYTATGLAAFAASTVGGLISGVRFGSWATFAYGAACGAGSCRLMLAGHGASARAPEADEAAHRGLTQARPPAPGALPRAPLAFCRAPRTDTAGTPCRSRRATDTIA